MKDEGKMIKEELESKARNRKNKEGKREIQSALAVASSTYSCI